MTSSDAKGRLYRLLVAFRERRLDTVKFCDQFERTFNLELDKTSLTPDEAESFGALFEKVIWYSPYPEERAQISNYLGESEIRSAADTAADRLPFRS